MSLLFRSNEELRKQFLAEFIGTALLLFLGLSIVIFLYGEGTPFDRWIPNIKVRQMLSGFLFGAIGGSLALSKIGKISGAHVNPAVTLVFFLYKKIDLKTTWVYMIAQLLGGIFGSIPLLLWSDMGKSINYAATTTGVGYTTGQALLGEIITTFGLVTYLILFIGFRKLRNYTPYLVPVLFAIMVPLEADMSGISVNPARSLGPSIVSGVWTDWWIYWVGPFAGAILAAVALSWVAHRITEAKLYHFDGSQDKLFRKSQ